MDIVHPETGDLLLKKGRMFNRRVLRLMQEAGINEILVAEEEILNRILARNIIHPKDGSLLLEANSLIDQEQLDLIVGAGIEEFEILFIDGVSSSDSIRKTLLLDRVETKEEAWLKFTGDSVRVIRLPLRWLRIL